MRNSISFAYISSYLGCADYRVYGDGEPYRIRLRGRISAYERSMFKGTEAQWRINLSEIGLLHRVDGVPITPRIVEAFNGWRADDHTQTLAEICQRYGPIADDNRVLVAPEAVRGGRYAGDEGWIPIDAASAPAGSSEHEEVRES
jgi:hypothetical protein